MRILLNSLISKDLRDQHNFQQHVALGGFSAAAELLVDTNVCCSILTLQSNLNNTFFINVTRNPKSNKLNIFSDSMKASIYTLFCKLQKLEYSRNGIYGKVKKHQPTAAICG